MDGASKILTVSYGTFSCTLEGFDDPFSTMRSIAEYFRDLAAEDRYFGAEPPTPDAEMLHRIAQTQSKTRVEAQIEDNSVVLRQSGHGEDALAAAGATAATIDDTAKAADDVDEPGEPAPAEGEASATLGEAVYAEDELAVALDTSEDTQSGMADASAQNSDTVAAKLSRIRAVVSGSDASDETDTDARFTGSIEEAFVDAEEAEWEDLASEADNTDEPVSEDDLDADVSTDDSPSLVEAGSDDAEPDAETDQDAADTDAESFFSDDDLLKAEDADGLATDDAQEDAQEDEATESAPALGLAARIVKLKRAAEEMSRGDDADDLVEAPEMEAPKDADSSLSDDDEVELQEELSRLEQEDTATAVSSDDDWNEDDSVLAEAEEEDKDEAEMRAAIAKATSLNLDSDDDTEDDTDAGDATEAARSERAQNLADGDTEDAALDRILEQTNTRMDDTEGSRRRSAIAHLKAAVAATKADRLLNRDRKVEDDAEVQSQYRDDLAKVVQAPASEEPAGSDEDDGITIDVDTEDEGGAPLVLVSDQRIDEATGAVEQDDDAHEATPDAKVIPRRATESDEDQDYHYPDNGESEAGFADFAEKMGATDLPDLLEAAAAYTAFVEGNKAFSRPQLMRRVAHYETDEEFSREAGLRSFGQLLRQGKIQKLRRGQFTIGEDTRFNPEARIAGE